MEDIIAQVESGQLCFRCGNCCRMYQVQMDENTARGIADRLGIEWAKFKTDYLDPRWKFHGSYLAKHRDGACIFLEQGEEGALCTIHTFKPESCLLWSMSLDKKECAGGLNQWGLAVDESGKIIGGADKMKQFRAFIGTWQNGEL